MKKTWLFIFVLMVVLTFAPGGEISAKSNDKGTQEVSSVETEDGKASSGKSWGHGKQGDGGNRVKSHFDYLDTDKDGKVSYEEFTAPSKKRFQSADTNGDGYLTPEEFGESWSGMKNKMHQKRSKGED